MVEPELSIALASGLVSVGYYGYLSCFGKKRKLKNERICSIVMSTGTGKSRLKHALNAISKGLQIVDVDEEVEQDSNKLNYLVKCKNYIKMLLKEFPKTKFLILCSSQEQSSYFGVKNYNVFVVTPSRLVFQRLIDNLTPSQEQLKTKMEIDRLELIKATNEEKLNIFASFNDLYTIIKQAYKLQSSF